jgi:sec-independent protein translocase protein TatA
MSDSATSSALFALFSLGGGEAILVLVLILILLGAKKLPDIARGLGEAFCGFRKHVGGVSKELDREAHDAGESLGGIYGEPAAQALTPDNETGELYNPAVFHGPRSGQRAAVRKWVRLCRLIWRRYARRLSSFIRISLLRLKGR